MNLQVAMQGGDRIYPFNFKIPVLELENYH